MIQKGVFDPKNFNPVALTYIKRFEPENFNIAWDKEEDFVNSITSDTDADYLYFPVGRYSYNFFDEGISRGFEETLVNHSKLCEKIKTLDKRVVLDYIYHPRLLKLYKDLPTKIMLDQHGRVTNSTQDAKELIIANY